MNLLLVTNLFPTPSDPERGVFTLQLVKRLQKYCNVTVVCPLPWFPSWSILPKMTKYNQYSKVPYQYNIESISVYSPKYPMIPRISENKHAFLMAIGIKNCLKNLHKKIRFDVVNSQWLYPDGVAVNKIVKTLNIPHVTTGLGCDINHDMYEPVKGKKILNTLHESNAITVVSNNMKDELIKNNFSVQKITVIPNGIDIDQFKILNKDECRKRLNIEMNVPFFLYVGRLSEEKNILTLINATSKLISNQKIITVYLVGDGPLADELTKITKQLNIEDYVSFVGKVKHSEIGLWMGACDYLCLPSIREGCPNVILEALGCGRPVIASRVGAIPDIVSAESGILFTPENVEELAQSLDQAINRSWSAEAISNTVSAFSWEYAAKKYYHVFKSTLEPSAT